MILTIPRYWTIKLPSQASGAVAPTFSIKVEPAFYNIKRIELFAYTCSRTGGSNIPPRIRFTFSNGLNEEEHYYSETVNPGGRKGTLLALPQATTDSRFLSVPMLVSHETNSLTQCTLQVGDWDGNSVDFTQLDLIFQVWVEENKPDRYARPPVDLIPYMSNTGLWRDGAMG